jgi:TonB family protein
MSSYALSHDLGLLADDSDRRFRRLVAVLAIPALIAGVVIPFVQISGLLKGGGMISPTRYAKLIQQQQEQPAEQKTSPVAKPRPQLTQEQKVEKARKKAEKAIASLQDSLASLRDADLPTVDKPLTQSQVISSTGGTRPNFNADAAKTSGGIGDTATVGRAASQTQLGQRKEQAVHSKIGEGKDASRAGMSGTVTGRSLEELQLVFDRNKGAFYTMYQRELRTKPDMRGKVVLRITIAPSGHVTKCSVVSSELHDPEFEKKVVARVMLLDFGPKNIGDFTVDYPIYFFPQN